MDERDLLPCPFCGGAALFDHDDHGWCWIECQKCGASTDQSVSAKEDCRVTLAESWNTRQASAAARMTAKELVEKIREASHEGDGEHLLSDAEAAALLAPHLAQGESK